MNCSCIFFNKKMQREDLLKKQLIRLSVFILLVCPALSQAAPFSVVGPRALGMGGASVAAVNDSTAVYWNPAALAHHKKVDIRIPVEAAAQDHIGLEDKWTEIKDIYSKVQAHDPVAINETIRLFQELDRPDTGADLDVSGGLLISFPVSGSSAVAISGMALWYAGLFPSIDTLNLSPDPVSTNFVGNNESMVTGIGIGTTQPALSFATSLGESFFIGANVKMIYAETYITSQTMTSNSFDDFMDDLTDSKTESSEASIDIGVLFAPVESVRIGIVGRDLNSPSFPVQGRIAQSTGSGVSSTVATGEIELEPQYRAGVAWQPYETFTLAADYDLTRNKTLTPGYESRMAAVGLEKTFLDEYFNIRLGANRNMEDSSAKTVYTGGLGLRLFALRLDLAAGYDFDEKQGAASVNLALRF